MGIESKPDRNSVKIELSVENSKEKKEENINDEKNPWNIQSLYELNYYICPSCPFKNHSKQILVNHAYEIHFSHAMKFLDAIKNHNSFNDVILPWNTTTSDFTKKVETDLERPKSSNNFREINFTKIDDDANDPIINVVEIKYEENKAENDTLILPVKKKKYRKSEKRGKSSFSSSSCNYCQKVFGNALKLKRHIMGVHEKSQTCEVCGYIFGEVHELKRHFLVVHEGRKDYICDSCGKPYSSRDSLKLHKKRDHMKQLDFQCDFCQKKFITRNVLKRHIFQLHDEGNNLKKNACHLCSAGQNFTTEKLLREHISEVHENIRSHECDLCDKTFVIRKDLDIHVTVFHKSRNLSAEGKIIPRRRQSEKKCYCLECGKAFINNYVLNEHKTSHTGEKPHACKFCGVTFSKRSNCVNHEKSVHHGIKRHKRK